MEYTNPRKEVTFNDWPYGNKRVMCSFYVEYKGGKERAVRVTQNPKGGHNKPKKLTYASRVLIVDGDDSKTYILQDNGFAIGVMQSNMKFQEEYIIASDARYDKLSEMFETTGKHEVVQ